MLHIRQLCIRKEYGWSLKECLNGSDLLCFTFG